MTKIHFYTLYNVDGDIYHFKYKTQIASFLNISTSTLYDRLNKSNYIDGFKIVESLLEY